MRVEMEVKFGEGLDFDVEGNGQQKGVSIDSPEKKNALEDIMRKGFRVPIAEADEVNLIINGISYQGFNLSASGIGIYLSNPGVIQKHAELRGITIELCGKSYEVNGLVRHLSQDEAGYLCGIELIDLGDDCQQEVITYLQKSRNTLFS